MLIEILHSPGCGSWELAHRRVQDVAAALAPDAMVVARDVVQQPDHVLRLAGSPTVLVDGIDLEPWVLPRLGAG